MKSTNLTNHFLVATPGLLDPNFFQTVTYIFSHNETGAMGVVINRPLQLELGDVLKQMDLPTEISHVYNMPVYDGGPVQTDRGFVIHKPDTTWQSSIRISDDIGVTTSKDILEAISSGRGPEKALIALGYAGWGPGQLEQEIRDNAWLTVPSGSDIIFDAPYEQRWESAGALLGIRIQDLSMQTGHA